jgi:hypothetical protein
MHTQRLDLLPNKKLEVRRLATELLASPEELIVRHGSALFALCHDKDFIIKQLAILSLAAIYSDLMPSYRVQDWSEIEDGGSVKVQLSKVNEGGALL